MFVYIPDLLRIVSSRFGYFKIMFHAFLKQTYPLSREKYLRFPVLKRSFFEGDSSNMKASLDQNSLGSVQFPDNINQSENNSYRFQIDNSSRRQSEISNHRRKSSKVQKEELISSFNRKYQMFNINS